MALDLKKCFNAALLPAAVLIVINVVVQLLVAFVPMSACIVGLPVLALNLAILGWAGYSAVKERGMDLVGGAVTGTIAGVIAGLAGGIIGLVLMVIGIGGALAASGTGGAGAYAATGAAIIGVAAIIGIVMGIVINAVEGAVCGAIGAYIAGMKK